MSQEGRVERCVERFCRPMPGWRPVLALPVAILTLFLIAGLLPSTPAEAASCTDTWIGMNGKSWYVPTEWSAGHVPTAADVVCINAGSWVSVAPLAPEAEPAVAKSVQGEGEMRVEEVLKLQNASSIRSLVVSGRLEIATSMTTRSLTIAAGTVTGGGSLVLAADGTGGTSPVGSAHFSSSTFVNEGTFTITYNNVIGEANGAKFVNVGRLDMKYETGIFDEGGAPSSVVNRGTIEKVEGTEPSYIQPPITNYGTINPKTGPILIYHPVGALASAATPGHACAADPVDCATGNLTESQTDLAIGGRGVGLDLTRTYSAQAAASGASGIFGHGWTNSFGARLAVEEGGAKVTLTDASGATVPFTRSGSTYLAPGWSRDTLAGSIEAGFTLTLPDRTKEGFSGAGRLESVTDRNANSTKLVYGGSGRLEKITDPTGRSITLAYNAQGLVEKATDPMAHVVRYTYESGNLKTVTLPGDVMPRWTFEYDGSNRMTAMSGGRGGRTTNEYDGSSRVVSQTDPVERTTTWTYEGFHTRITSQATGAVTDEWFNSYNQPVSITRGYGTPSAVTESFTYTEAGLLAGLTDGNGHATTYGYDAESNRTSERDAEGDETKWTFNTSHQILTETTPRGEKTTIERDAVGNPKTISRPAPEAKTQTVSYAYGTHGEVESMTDPLGNKWTYGYDSYGDRVSETDPLADKRTWAYDADSRATSTVSPRGNETGAEAAKFTTSVERDAQGRPVKVTDPLGGATRYAYDADGEVESITDPKARKTKFVYDAADERTKVERPDGSTEETGYDGAGRVTSQTDGRKNKTAYVRNVLEQPVEVIDPLQRKTTQTFDAAGNLKTKADPEGRITTYVYDKADRPKEITFSAEAAKNILYGYDADGDLTKMVDQTGESNYEYDQLGRLTHSRNGHGEAVGWGYNLAEESVALTYPNGKSISRAYDKAGRLESVTDWLAHKTSFAYNRDSEPTKTTFPTATGNIDEYGYDRADRMSGVTMKKGTTTLASLVYVRDPAGLLESLTSKGLPGAESEAFGYDVDERLTKAGASSYEYDAANNPIKAPSTVNAFDKADELESATGSTFAYDKEGDRTKRTPSSGPATTYRYDQTGQLTSIERAAGEKTSAIAESFGYDGLGLLSARTATGSMHHFVWDPTESPEALLTDGEYSYVYGPGDLPIEQISAGGAPTYLHHDQIGSTRLVTNSSGEAAGAFTYGPYGGTTGSTGTATATLGYAGQYTLAQSGLQYLRARFYDPATAQFLSVDSLTSITLAPYLYGGDDPANRRDRTGRAAESLEGGCPSPICFPFPVAAEAEGAAEALEALPGELANEVEGVWNSIFGDEDSDSSDETADVPDCGVTPDLGGVSPKIERQIGTRGWTPEEIEEAFEEGAQFDAVNKANGNPATRYINPKTGRSVVIDDKTGEIIHVGGDGFRYGPESGDLP